VTLLIAAIVAAPCLYQLARPVAATKVEDSAAARFQPSAFSAQLFGVIFVTSPRNAEKLQIKNLGFFRRLRCEKVALRADLIPAQSAKKRGQLSAISFQPRTGNSKMKTAITYFPPVATNMLVWTHP